MSRAFTSGENTADIQAEKKINKNGLAIFVVALAFILLAFMIWAVMFTSIGSNGSGSQKQQPTENSRAQP